MAGAYTAKPEAVPDPPDVPDGWNVDWPHPGAIPPGYTPDYTLDLQSVPEETSAEAWNPALSLLTDVQDSVAWRISPGSATQTWTATLDGSSIDLKGYFDGGDFASSVALDYVENDGWHYVSEYFAFDIDRDDFGKTVVVKSECKIGFDTFYETAELEVDSVRISGTIVDQVGQPVNGAQVAFRSAYNLQIETDVTGSDGKYDVAFTWTEDYYGYEVAILYGGVNEAVVSLSARGDYGDYVYDRDIFRPLTSFYGKVRKVDGTGHIADPVVVITPKSTGQVVDEITSDSFGNWTVTPSDEMVFSAYANSSGYSVTVTAPGYSGSYTEDWPAAGTGRVYKYIDTNWT